MKKVQHHRHHCHETASVLRLATTMAPSEDSECHARAGDGWAPLDISQKGLDRIRLQEGKVVCSDTATCTELQEDISVYRCNRAPTVEQHSCCINACSSDEISGGYLCTYYDTGSCMTNGYVSL